MTVRNDKYEVDGFVYYRMQRGEYVQTVSVTSIELATAREVVAMRLRNARAKLDFMRRWGLLR